MDGEQHNDNIDEILEIFDQVQKEFKELMEYDDLNSNLLSEEELEYFQNKYNPSLENSEDERSDDERSDDERSDVERSDVERSDDERSDARP